MNIDEVIVKNFGMAGEMMFEIFSDPAYFDMWCVRLAGSKDFNTTLHFQNRQLAEHAVEVLNVLILAEREACAKVCDEMESAYCDEWKTTYSSYHEGGRDCADGCGAAIRARGGSCGKP